MAEPEELIIEGAYVATRFARATWRKYARCGARWEMELSAIRPRLELFLAALLERPIVIAAAEPPPPVTLLARLAGARRPGVARHRQPFPGTDGERIFLPPVLPIATTEEDTLSLYRLLAVEQAARLVRGAAARYHRLEDDSQRNAFLLGEAAAVDRWIAREVPGLRAALASARAAALAEREKWGQSPFSARSDRKWGLSPFSLERRIRALLAADPAAPPALDAPMDAESAAAHKAVAGVWYWGLPLDPPPSSRADVRLDAGDEPPFGRNHRPRVTEMRRRPRPREANEGEDDRGSGTWVIRADEPQESIEDPYGLQRPADRDDHADPDGLGDSLSDLPEARVVRTPGQAREVLRSGDEIPRTAAGAERAPSPTGVSYPEWDYRSGTYRVPGAIVREPAAPPGDPSWVTAALARHGRLVRRVRARFERMQPRYVRLDRQADGSDVDIDAFVTAAADVRAGVTVDGRLYVAERPARRELAVALLVDISASTDAWVASDRRIVDVEKEALLVVCEALDALGDRYAIYAFSGEGARDVTVRAVKRFEERSGAPIRRRIAGLDSDRYTRMGAAIRHLTTHVTRERADRRLVLVLSDGKPNDDDLYEGRYGVEDTRQAVAEARRQGVAVFCLTIDRAAPRYAGRIFGRSGFALLQRADQLPAVVVEALRHLIRA